MRVLGILAPLVTIVAGVVATWLRVLQHRRPRPATMVEKRRASIWMAVFAISAVLVVVTVLLFMLTNFSVSS